MKNVKVEYIYYEDRKSKETLKDRINNFLKDKEFVSATTADDRIFIFYTDPADKLEKQFEEIK